MLDKDRSDGRPGVKNEFTKQINPHNRCPRVLVCGACIGLALVVSVVEAHLARGGKLPFWKPRSEPVQGTSTDSKSNGAATDRADDDLLLTDSEMLRRLVSDVTELRNEMRDRAHSHRPSTMQPHHDDFAGAQAAGHDGYVDTVEMRAAVRL